MDAAHAAFAAAGCSVLVVAQAKPEVLSLYLSRQGWHVPIVSDPGRGAYRAFGLERASWLAFFRPRVVWKYLRGMRGGYRVKKPYAGEDVRQLGGDFVLDRAGRVAFAYPSADPTDRPSAADLLRTVQSDLPTPGERRPDGPQVDSARDRDYR